MIRSGTATVTAIASHLGLSRNIPIIPATRAAGNETYRSPTRTAPVNGQPLGKRHIPAAASPTASSFAATFPKYMPVAVTFAPYFPLRYLVFATRRVTPTLSK